MAKYVPKNKQTNKQQKLNQIVRPHTQKKFSQRKIPKNKIDFKVQQMMW